MIVREESEMKTVAVIYLGRRGGGPVYAYEMTKGLIENGYHVYAFVSDGVENIEQWRALRTVATEEISTYHSEASFVFNSIAFRMHRLRKLRKKYKDVHVDACYVPMGHTWSAYIWNIFKDAQLIYTIHDPIDHSTNRPIYRSLMKMGEKIMKMGIKEKKPDDIIILSKTFKEYVCQKYQMSEEHVHVLPHGVFDFYQKLEGGKTFTYATDKVNFVFFGRICAYKGLDVLAEAFRCVKQERPDVALTIVGSGDFSFYAPYYRDLCDVTVVNEWIPDEDVAGFFKSEAKLILVLPYVDATQSGVIPIAMSCGVPVIASNTGGLSEQVDHEVTGLLCAPGDAKDLARCMLQLAASDNTGMIEKARNFIATLGWDVLSAELGRLVK